MDIFCLYWCLLCKHVCVENVVVEFCVLDDAQEEAFGCESFAFRFAMMLVAFSFEVDYIGAINLYFFVLT